MKRTPIGPPGRVGLAALVLSTLLAAAGCDDFLRVDNPGVIDDSVLAVEEDLATFSLSARQDFAFAYGFAIVHSAWFTGEALVAETFVGANDFGRRDVSPANGLLLSQLWTPLSVARASAEELLRHTPRSRDPEVDLHLARAALFSGYSLLLTGEYFCAGAIGGGPPLESAAVLDSAAARFTRALELAGTAATSTRAETRAEAAQLTDAALVGRARARLQVGRRAEAAADAERVTPDFAYLLPYADDPTNRGRLGNRVWDLTAGRGSVAVAPAFRGLNDPRVPVRPPGPPFLPFDGITEFWTQAKYPGYAAPIRLASKLEADYIAAEARGTASMLDLVQQRRAANGQPPYTGSADAESVLAELMDQRAREFWLEGKTLGDLRRNPAAVRYLPRPGTPYHKPGYEPVRDQTCLPLPEKETLNNPNFP